RRNALVRWKNRICLGPGSSVTKGISQVKASHARPVRRAVFDEPNLLAAAGLVPVVALADRVGLQELADQFLTVPTDKGAGSRYSSMEVSLTTMASCSISGT